MNMRVSGKSNPNSVAGMIANIIKNGAKQIRIDCVGASAVNQGIKAIAISRGFVASAGYDLICIPAFKEIEVNGERRTAIQLIVEIR